MDMTRNEELAALKVLKKQIQERLDELEFGIKQELLEAYENSDGDVDSFNVRVAGLKVGKATLALPTLRASLAPGKEAEAIEFLREHGLTEEKPVNGWQNSFVNVGGEAVYQETGEVCEGIVLQGTVAPHVRLTGFKADAVREAFQARGIEAGDVLRLAGGLDV